MKEKYTILVTSCGGNGGQSIGKILKNLEHKTFGWDISSNNAAKFIFDHFETCLKITEPNYLLELSNYIKKNKIDIIIPVSELELRFYTENKEAVNYLQSVKVLMADSFTREIGFDKTKTSLFLKENGLPFPNLYSLENEENIVFPLIAKPRTGMGSSNIFIVEEISELKFIYNKYEDLILQEMLDGTQGEFTCCVYRSANKEVRTIIFKRELTVGGYSGYGEVIENNKIEKLLLDLAKSLDLKGSINVQLRLHKGEPVIFEINPRFSSTILFRHLLGFNDLKWSIQDAFDCPISKYKKIKKGAKFYKGYNEYIED
jgi:carbamoyl-phosphate synthase large subunit